MTTPKYKIGDVVISRGYEKRTVIGVFSNVVVLAYIEDDLSVNKNSIFTIDSDDPNWHFYSVPNYDLLSYTFKDIEDAWHASRVRAVSEEYETSASALAPDFDEYMETKYALKAREALNRKIVD